MKKIKLSQGFETIVDDADFELASKYKWSVLRRGKQVIRYHASRRKSGGGTEYLHRILLSPPRGMVVDHINGDGLDNRRSNLRVCSQRENSRNGAPKRSARIHKGTTRVKNRWRAVIFQNRKRIHLGYFDSELEASKAYNQAAIKYHGEFARLNPITKAGV